MDIGALIQSFAGDPVASKGNEMAGSTNTLSNWQSSGNTAGDDEKNSFIFAVRQILGKTDSAKNATNEDSQIDQCPTNDVSQMILVLEMLGPSGIDELKSMTGTETDPDPEGAEADLLSQLNAQLAGLQATQATPIEVSGDKTEIESNMLPLLKNKMAVLETSIAESATVINDDTPDDLQKTLSLIKTAMGQRIDQDQNQAPVVKLENGCSTDHLILQDKAFLNDDVTESQQNIVDVMGSDHSDDTSSADLKNAQVLTKQATALNSSKEPAIFNVQSDAGNNEIVQEKADAMDGKINNAKSFDRDWAAQHENTPFQQPSDQSSSENSADKKQTMEWSGLGKETLKGESMVAEQPQPSTSTEAQDELVFANKKQASQNDRQPQTIETKPTPLDSTQQDTLLGDSTVDSTKVSVSTESTVTSKPLATATTGHATLHVSDDTAFQKTVMDQIVEKATFQSADGRSEMRIQLKPETLGDVRMHVVAEKDQLVVQMIADKSETKEIIESQIHHLRAELDKQGLMVGKIEVLINAGNDQQDSREQFFQMFKNNSDGSGKRQGSAKQESAPHHQHSEEKDADSGGDGINYFV